MATIVVTETDAQVLEHIVAQMREDGLHPSGFLDVDEAIAALNATPPDAVLMGGELEGDERARLEDAAGAIGVPIVHPIGRTHWREAVLEVLGGAGHPEFDVPGF